MKSRKWLYHRHRCAPGAGDQHVNKTDSCRARHPLLRREGFADGTTSEAAAVRSTAEGDKVPDDIRWIRSYVLSEEHGGRGGGRAPPQGDLLV